GRASDAQRLLGQAAGVPRRRRDAEAVAHVDAEGPALVRVVCVGALRADPVDARHALEDLGQPIGDPLRRSGLRLGGEAHLVGGHGWTLPHPRVSGRPVATPPDRLVRAALATAREARGLDPDEPLLLATLAGAGIPAEPAVWDDPAVEWGTFDLVLVRSTWDYPPPRPPF